MKFINDSFLGEIKMFNTDYDIKVYSKEELVSEIYVRGSSVTFKNYNYLYGQNPTIQD